MTSDFYEPHNQLPTPAQMAVRRSKMAQVEKEPEVLKEVLDLLQMALRQYRADINPVKAMELLQNIVALIKINGGI